MVSSTDFLRASERTTAIATLNRRHHAEGSPLPRREQWTRQGRSLESLTPRPGIREQNLPYPDMISHDGASGRWAQWVPNTISDYLVLGTGRRKLSPTYLGGVCWPATVSSVDSLPSWQPMWQ